MKDRSYSLIIEVHNQMSSQPNTQVSDETERALNEPCNRNFYLCYPYQNLAAAAGILEK